MARATETYQAQLDQPALDYLEGRGLHTDRVIETHRLGVVRSPLQGHEKYVGRLVVPYIGPRGNIYGLKFKCIEDHDHKDSEVKCPKVLSWDDLPSRMYNTQALTAPTDYIFLAEGEPDTWTYTACGWPAVGLPGVDSWKPHHARMLAGFSKVILLAHGDDAGRKLAAKVSRSLPSTCDVMVVPEGQDVNSLYQQGGRDAIKALINDKGDDE